MSEQKKPETEQTQDTAAPTAEKRPIDAATYEAAKPYLKAAMEHMLAAGRSAREAGEYALERFGDAFLPYLQEFAEDVKHGRIEIQGLAQSAKATLFGRHVTREEREQMIRDAAFYRAEKHGFSGGSEAEDWAEAEREIDALLAQETGLVERGRQALSSLASLADKELANLKHSLASWLQSRPAVQGDSAGEQPAAAKKAPVKKAASKKAVSKKATKKKAATKKKTVKKASAKKAVSKKTVKKAVAKKAVKKAAPAKKGGDGSTDKGGK